MKTTIKRSGAVRFWDICAQTWETLDCEHVWSSDAIMTSLGYADARRVALAYARRLSDAGYSRKEAMEKAGL
jgi:CHAD domain-containing protein